MRLLGPVGTVVVSNAPRWSPLRLGSSLIAWWSADDHGTASMTDDGSGLISSWKDRIGALDTTATTTARPTWTAGSFNNKLNGLVFDGTANCLAQTSLGNLPVSSTAGMIVSVATNTAAGTAGDVFRYGGTGASSCRGLRKNASDVGLATDFTVTASSTISVLQPSIMIAEYVGTSLNLWVDGTPSAGNPTTIASLNTGTTRLRIGATNAVTAAGFWSGSIRHIMVTLDITSNQRQQLEGWAAWDGAFVGALAAGHPYKNHAP